MTAEVAILNKYAVALAADSAATRADAQKVFSAHKLFQLSRHHPIGVMIYGSNEFMGVPYETIIKFYRSKLGLVELPTLTDYADHFLDFLASARFSQRESIEYNVGRIVRSTFSGLANAVQRSIVGVLRSDKNKKVSSRVLRELADTAIETALDEMKRSTAESVHFRTPSDLSGEFKHIIEREAKSRFERFGVKKETLKRLIELALLVLATDKFSEIRSGIVVAGFGREEFLPSIVSYVSDGIIGSGVHKIIDGAKQRISLDMESAIVPFAQPDMVYRFMEGIDRKFEVSLESDIRKLLNQFSADLAAKFFAKHRGRGKIELEMANMAQKLANDFVAQIKERKYNEFALPILNIVKSLPKEELGSFAEALVSLTSLKRRVSLDQETVGGPVDVAVISKGDGFIWIKRKHYFNMSLNPQYSLRVNAANSGEVPELPEIDDTK